MFNRSIATRLIELTRRKYSRIVTLVGARQIGKTTLARHALPDWPYVTLDDPVSRLAYTSMSAVEWVQRFPVAIVDEAQKAPGLLDTIKAAHDLEPTSRYVLLGSSQIHLLSEVRESLAGRTHIQDMWPLTLPEMATSSWQDPVSPSRLVTWLEHGARSFEALEGIPTASRSFGANVERFEQYVHFGGMPVVHDLSIDDDQRWDWLTSYHRTWLERDLADLATFRNLDPFLRLRQAVAYRTATGLNLADLARVAGVTPATAQKFLRYMELSYQTLLLPAWSRNRDKRLVKMPKIHFLDPGVLRSLIQHRGPSEGLHFESAVVAEITKQIRTGALPVQLYHLRTHDHREVDVLLETTDGFIALEVKSAERVSSQDARHLRHLESLLDKPLLASLLVSRDRQLRHLDPGILAIPAAWLLGAMDPPGGH